MMRNGEIYLHGGPVEKQNDFNVGGGLKRGDTGPASGANKLTKSDGKNGDL